VARGRRHVGRGQAPGALPPWPLDPPPVATPPTADGHAPTVGSYIPTPAHGPGPRTFYCRQCRVGVQATDCPDQWLRLQLRDAAAERRHGRSFTTVALFCGLPCLTAWATTTSRVTP
jgi:hypothetical protein